MHEARWLSGEQDADSTARLLGTREQPLRQDVDCSASVIADRVLALHSQARALLPLAQGLQPLARVAGLEAGDWYSWRGDCP